MPVLFSNKLNGKNHKGFPEEREATDDSHMTDIALIGENLSLREALRRFRSKLSVSLPRHLRQPLSAQVQDGHDSHGLCQSPDYSKTLPALQRLKSNISDFVKKGGVLTVFGPMVPEHDYDWLPLPLSLCLRAIAPRALLPLNDECSCLLCTRTPECDGYLIAGEGFETVLKDEKGQKPFWSEQSMEKG